MCSAFDCVINGQNSHSYVCISFGLGMANGLVVSVAAATAEDDADVHGISNSCLGFATVLSSVSITSTEN